jgi:bacillopeptidase F
LLAAPFCHAASIDSDLQDELASAASNARLPIIVFYAPKVAANDLAVELATARQELRRRSVVLQLRQGGATASSGIVKAATAAGAEHLQLLWIANAVSMEASPALIQSLAARNDVTQIRADLQQEAPIAYAGAALPAEWNINLVNAPAVWARGLTGTGAVIASLDSGVDDLHPDLRGSYRGGANSWFDPYDEHADPTDTNGHGTQSMGIMVGAANSGNAIGVAPGAKWIAARIFNNQGRTQESAIHRALQWAIDPDGNPATDDAPDVVNNSWDIADEGACRSVFQTDIDALHAADIAVVFSAGNYGPTPGTSVSPANTRNVISVGAIDANRNVAIFSSRGPSACDGGLFPKLVAPGVSVLTSDLSFNGLRNYVLVDGTSFAAPHVSGAIALLRGASPLSSVAEIESALTRTAKDIGTVGPDQGSGYGLVDAAAALDALPIADMDKDGYGSGRDCNDHDASIHPLATDRARDGIDQDCNGYDQTIEVKYAVYSHDGGTLKVRASSMRGSAAELVIVDVGPMIWRPQYRDWIYDGDAKEIKRQLTVSGIEGQVVTAARQPTPKPEPRSTR